MKIRMTVTIELDPKDWTATFGTESTTEIREDVKSYVQYNLLEAGELGSGAVPATFTVT